MYDFKSERTENQNCTIKTRTSQHVEFFHSLIFLLFSFLACLRIYGLMFWLCFQMSLERGSNVIICIFMPNVQQRQLPGSLRLITKTVTCIKWSPDPKAQKVFWLKLYKGLVD